MSNALERLLRSKISLRLAGPSARLCGGKEEKDHGGEIGNGGADDRGGRADCGNRNGSDIRAEPGGPDDGARAEGAHHAVEEHGGLSDFRLLQLFVVS